jgi:ABC-type uncharacterized transport system substrate-binding protein
VKRREFITLLGGAGLLCAAKARRAWAQQPAVVGFLSGRAREESADDAAAFRQGLNEMGYIIGRNVALEYRWTEGHDERLPELAAELVRRQVAVIAAVGGNNSAFAAKAATADIPIVFTSGADPVKVGLVTSLNRPGGNVTGVSWFGSESLPKRLGILGELVPKIKLAVLLVNPNMPELADQPEAAQQTAHALGWQLQVVEAHRVCRGETTTHGCHHRRCRSVLSHPPDRTRRSGRPSRDSGDLWEPRNRDGRRPNQLRQQPSRRLSPRWPADRPHPQGCQGGRSARRPSH